MANVRSFNSLGVFAEDANTTIPAEPVSGTAYRDNTTTDVQNKAGVKYDDVYESAVNNQTSFIISSFTDAIANHGITGWSNSQDYTLPAITYGSDSKFYTALLVSGPAGAGAKDPTSQPTYWKELDLNITALLADETSPDEGTGLVGHTNQPLKTFLGSPSNPKYIDSGAVNAIVLNPVQSLVAVPTNLNEGREVVFKPAIINTAATSLEVGSTGSKSVKIINQDGSFADPYAGYFQTTIYYKATFFVDDNIWIVERYFKSQDGSNIFASLNMDGVPTIGINKSKNILSIARLGTGNYTGTFHINPPDTNYNMTGFCRDNDDIASFQCFGARNSSIKTTSVFEFYDFDGGDGSTSFDTSEIAVNITLNES